jgi:hypothetical protein
MLMGLALFCGLAGHAVAEMPAGLEDALTAYRWDFPCARPPIRFLPDGLVLDAEGVARYGWTMDEPNATVHLLEKGPRSKDKARIDVWFWKDLGGFTWYDSHGKIGGQAIRADAVAAQEGRTAAGPGKGAPSAQIAPLLEPGLNAILAPLASDPPMPRVPVEQLRASLAGGAVQAKTASAKQIYQYAMAVCEALANAMDERAQVRATALASAQTPSVSNGASIVKTSPLHGWDAGGDAREIRKKQKDERAYADQRGQAASGFAESAAAKAWTGQATILRNNVMGLYTKLVQFEAMDPAFAPVAAAAK